MKLLGRERVVAGRRERLAASLKTRSPPHQQLPLAEKTFAYDGGILTRRNLGRRLALRWSDVGGGRWQESSRLAEKVRMVLAVLTTASCQTAEVQRLGALSAPRQSRSSSATVSDNTTQTTCPEEQTTCEYPQPRTPPRSLRMFLRGFHYSPECQCRLAVAHVGFPPPRPNRQTSCLDSKDKAL
jgi:hypothetical protein